MGDIQVISYDWIAIDQKVNNQFKVNREFYSLGMSNFFNNMQRMTIKEIFEMEELVLNLYVRNDIAKGDFRMLPRGGGIVVPRNMYIAMLIHNPGQAVQLRTKDITFVDRRF